MSSVARLLMDHPSFSQSLFFISVFAVTWVLEKRALKQPAFDKARHTSFNLVFLALAMPIQLVMIAICLGVAQWTSVHHWGLLWLLPDATSPWLRYGAMFLVLDFLDYVYHYLAHRVPALWRLHLVHHSDEAVDVSTTFREHPGETFVRTCFLILWVFLCGAPIALLVLRQTFESIANVSQHFVFRLPPRAARLMGLVFVTPNLHHVHHHFRLPGTDCNYGDVFSIWDRLFGTYVADPGEAILFGVDTHMGAGLLSLLGLGWLEQMIKPRQEPVFARSEA